MTQEVNHHPLLMDETGRKNLLGTCWHSRIEDRYPSGSKAELFRRSQAFFYRWLARINGNPRVLEAEPMQPETFLLDQLASPAVDVIGPTFIVSQNGSTKTILVLEDHLHNTETSYAMGKTTIVQRLLRLALVDWQVRQFLGMKRGEKIDPDSLMIRLNQTNYINDGRIKVPQFSESPFKLLAGDVTFLGCNNDGQLVAMATVGTREDFLFDIARSGIRRLLKNYNRVDDNIMAAQAEITTRLDLTDSVWADTQKLYPVDEIVFLSPRQYWFNVAKWRKSMSGFDPATELYSQLVNNPLYIASQIGYWDINPETHQHQVEIIMSKMNEVPKIRYLGMANPKNPYALKSVADLLKKEFKPEIMRV